MINFLLLYSIPLYEYYRFIYPSHIEYLDCFQFGIIKNSAAVNVLEMFLHYLYLTFFGLCTWKWKFWSCRGYTFSNCRYHFPHSTCPNLHSHQHCMSFRYSHPCQCPILLVCQILALLWGMESYPIVVLICILLVINMIQDIFMSLDYLDIHSWKCAFKFYSPFSIGLSFLKWICSSLSLQNKQAAHVAQY